MGVRKTHNRVKKQPMGKDMNEVIKEAKKYHKGWNEFYIFIINDVEPTYYSDGIDLNNKAIKHFKNVNKFNERAKWIEISM